MPFLFAYLPKKLLNDQPSIASALNANVWRLTCQFDVFETLVDILNTDYGSERSTLFNRGKSLFSEVLYIWYCSKSVSVSLPLQNLPFFFR